MNMNQRGGQEFSVDFLWNAEQLKNVDAAYAQTPLGIHTLIGKYALLLELREKYLQGKVLHHYMKEDGTLAGVAVKSIIDEMFKDFANTTVQQHKSGRYRKMQQTRNNKKNDGKTHRGDGYCAGGASSSAVAEVKTPLEYYEKLPVDSLSSKEKKKPTPVSQHASTNFMEWPTMRGAIGDERKTTTPRRKRRR